MKNLFTEVEKELPLTMEEETDCCETWPDRWALLKAKVEKIYNTLYPQVENACFLPCSCLECIEKDPKVPCMSVYQ